MLVNQVRKAHLVEVHMLEVESQMIAVADVPDDMPMSAVRETAVQILEEIDTKGVGACSWMGHAVDIDGPDDKMTSVYVGRYSGVAVKYLMV
ncbi:hypothetical protein D3C76_850680 [compost metagenome]